MIRRALERLSHGVTLRSRLPRRIGNYPIIVSPDARLGFWRGDVESMDRILIMLAEEFVPPGGVVWDIGANVGIFALAAAARAGTSGRVLAVEADTWLVDLMRRTCKLECDPRAPIDVLPAAIDAELGIATFNIASRGRAANFLEGAGSSQTGGSRQQQKVMTASLDWLLGQFPKPDVLKIDVEGAELRVLRGAKSVLETAQPVMICEVSSDNAQEATRILHSYGYTLFDMEDPNPAKRTPIALATANIIAVPAQEKS